MNRVHTLLLVTTTLAALPVAADDAPVERRNFVACPVVRDTQTVPCWLAEYDGELYFLTLQTDVSSPVTPPWLGHRVLVEGTVARERPRICGGVVLEPVVLSVLPEIDAACNTPVLPAEERYNLTFEPPRPPGPSAGRLAFAGAAPPPAPAEPPRTFTLRYDFDGLVVFRHAGALTEILDAARARKARTVSIIGHRGSVLLSNGTTLTEQASIARRRAEQIATLLRGAGLTDVEFTLDWQDEPGATDGRDDATLRRVTVELTP
jgi:hypothetical protein